MSPCPRRIVLNTLGAAIVVSVCFFCKTVEDIGFNKLRPKKLALATPESSGADAGGVGDREGNSNTNNADAAVDNVAADAAVESLAPDGEQLVSLKPGDHIGPYRLQEHLGFLGSRPVHEYDPAFHPHAAKRVGFSPRGMLSPPPRPPVCPPSRRGAAPRPSSRRNGAGGGDEGDDALVLKGGPEDNSAEGSYRLKRRFEGGSHGEVWRGVRLGPDGKPSLADGYVLKRMLLEKGQHVLQAGIREIYFGELLQSLGGSPQIARAGEEAAAGEGGTGGPWDTGEAVPTEMWLVFRDEGMSLRHYLYTEREAEGFVLHGQSYFWRDMRLDPKGPEVMKSILRQTLEGTRFLHETGVVHRDLKPSNLIVSLPPVEAAAATTTTARHAPPPGPRPGSSESTGDVRRTGGSFESADVGGENKQGSSSSSSSSSSARRKRLLLRVADFSSAVDEGAMPAGLYGTEGPSQGEETLQYAPPEVLFDPETAYSAQRPESYDMWSIGVILLELILGTPEVFTVDQRTRAILDRDLAFEDDEVRAKAHLLAAMADMCIYSGPGSHDGEGSSSPLGDAAVVDERCTLAELGRAVHTRDALDIGFPDQWGLDLLWRLLRWDPMSRISASDALEHAYFVGPYRSRRDGTLHATQRDAMEYDGWFTGSKRVSPTAVAPRSPPSPYAAVWGAAAPPGGNGFNDKGRGGLVPSAEPPRAAARGEAKQSFTLDHQHTLNLKYTCPKVGSGWVL
ncbi:unnamed protein product [Ectocarpus fasciculatus]